MGFQANVVRVMIASPGDVSEERRIVTEEIYRWNDAHAVARKLILQPIKWETHSTPQLGISAQTILNEQILEDVDILIGIFGTRIGTPTEQFVSGTVEEIKLHVGAGKTAKVYFSDVPVPPSQINPQQYEALQRFKEECRSGGLYATYNDLAQFRDDLRQHLAIELNTPRYKWLLDPQLPSESIRESALSAEAKKALLGASVSGGRIMTIRTTSGENFFVGAERLADGTPRSIAIWKEAILELKSRSLIEQLGSNAGNYRLTAAGYRIVDEISKDESDQKRFEISLAMSGTAKVQALQVNANKIIRIRQIEFLTSSEACIATQDIDLEGTETSIPLEHAEVVKLFNAPRTDRNPIDFSGPAILRLTYEQAGAMNSIDLPVMIQPVFANSAQYVSLTGQKRFYL